MERANAVGGADGPLAPGTGWGPFATTVRYVEHFAANGHGADFGAAYFTGPGEWSTPSPFQMGHPGLFINVFYDRRINHWRSGCIATVDCNATGFSQSMGYWECKMWVPNGQGVFPAFWIKSTNDIPAGRQVNSSEIDIVEAYGTQPGSSYNWMTKLHSIVHVWLPNGGNGVGGAANTATVSDMSSGYHTYGCLINSDFIHFYYDGVEIFHCSTPPEALLPMYGMIDLALSSDRPIGLPITAYDGTSGSASATLRVAYIQCWAHN